MAQVIYRHKKCGWVKTFADWKAVSQSTEYQSIARCKCPGCGKLAVFAAGEVKGHLNAAHQCDARCMFAVGFVCDCSCGGKNHGMGHNGEVPAQIALIA